MKVKPKHPAPFNKRLIPEIEKLLEHHFGEGPALDIFDPFIGEGRIHLLHDEYGHNTFGIDISPEWANMHQRSSVGNILTYRTTRNIDAVVTSPTYGNRLADKHEAKDKCKKCKGKGTFRSKVCPSCKGNKLSRRNSYRHRLGRALKPDDSSGMQWGPEYREFHEKAWAKVHALLSGSPSRWVDGGAFVLNMKNHIRGGEEMKVTEWHIETIKALGFEVVKKKKVKTPGLKDGQNRDARIDFEWLILFRLVK